MKTTMVFSGGANCNVDKHPRLRKAKKKKRETKQWNKISMFPSLSLAGIEEEKKKKLHV